MGSQRILIVEDDPAQVETWERQIERNNAKSEMQFSMEFAATPDEVKVSLERHKFDAAIVDIRLRDASGTTNATRAGNEVRDLLLASEVLLIAHITGEPNEVKFENDMHKDLVKVFVKADAEDEEKSVHEEILSWLEGKSNIVDAIKKTKATISENMADLFYQSIWPRWGNWQADAADSQDFVHASITRHMVSHLYAKLLDAENALGVHPEEWYFQPPSKERFHTGDLTKSNNDYYVLVTPRCDMERLDAGNSLIFAKMNIIENWSEKKKALDEKTGKLREQMENTKNDEEKENIEKKISKSLSNFRREYYGHNFDKVSNHFLPEVKQSGTKIYGPFFVDFSNIISVTVGSDLEAEMMRNKIAALSPEFVPELVQRLGTYISRIGSPDYSHLP